MDKIITITLGGYAIKMEEEAYEALKPYIHQIEKAFINTENGKEIINDIEARIAEMLLERIANKVGATVADVDYVKKNMGNPQEFENAETGEEYEDQAPKNENVRKRLYRDGDAKLLGGVAAGISNYFNIDPTVIRLIWVVLFFFFGTGLLLYIILWIIVPEAVTTAQKFEMNGEAPTLDNIINRVKTEATRVEQNIKSQHFGKRISDIFQSLSPLIAFFLKGVAVLVGIILLTLLSALLVVLIGGPERMGVFQHNHVIHFIPNVFEAAWEFVTLKTLIAFLIGIPLFSMLAGLLKFVFNSKVNFRPIGKVLGFVWLMTIPLLIYFSYLGIRNFRSDETVRTEKSALIKDNFLIQTNFREVDDLFDQMHIRILPSNDSLFHLETIESASGYNSENARKNAEKIDASFTLENNTVTLTTSKYYSNTGLYRNQKVKFILKVPKNKTFMLDQSVNRVHTSVEGRNLNYYTNKYQHNEQKLLFINQDLFCTTCPDSLPEGTYSNSRHSIFTSIKIDGFMDVEIRNGRDYNVEKMGPSSSMDKITIAQEDETLTISMRDGESYFKTKPKIIITMPELRYLELNGATSCRVDRFAGNSLNIGCNGASNLEIDAMYDELNIEMSGASHLNLSGKVQKLDLDISGASKINAKEMVLNAVRIELSGASFCHFGAVNVINGEMSGASKLEYKGNPVVDVETNGLSKINRTN